MKSWLHRLRHLLLGNLWQRHMLLSVGRATATTLLALFAFYICLDASINSSEIKLLEGPFSALNHYGLHFFKRIPQLLPFSLALVTVQLLLRMQRNHELVSLTMDGLSRWGLLLPFLKVGLSASCLVLMCTEGWLFSPAELKSFQANPIRWVGSGLLSNAIPQYEAIPLDHQLQRWLVYRDFNQGSFTDVFWIESSLSWWHFDRLRLTVSDIQEEPAAHNVLAIGADHFERNGDNCRLWSAHYDEHPLSLDVDLRQLAQEARGAQALPIVDLWKALEGDYPRVQRPRLLAYLYFRLIQPLLCLFAPLPAAIMTLRQRRHLSPFWTYLVSLGTLVMLFMIQQSGLLLACANRLHPFWSVACPTAIAFAIVSFSIRRS